MQQHTHSKGCSPPSSGQRYQPDDNRHGNQCCRFTSGRAACNNVYHSGAHGYAHDGTEAADTSCQPVGHVPNGLPDATAAAASCCTAKSRRVAGRDVHRQALLKLQPAGSTNGAGRTARQQDQQQPHKPHQNVLSVLFDLSQDFACSLYRSFVYAFGISMALNVCCQGQSLDVQYRAVLAQVR